jgi:ATP-binding cassette subfamily B protein
MKLHPFPVYRQLDSMDCGPTCLRMISKYYGKNHSIAYLRELAHLTREGVSLFGISEAAEKIGFKTLAVSIDFEQFINNVPLPCIIHWGKAHFVVVPPQKLDKARSNGKITIADPDHGLVKVDKKVFLENWIATDSKKGIVLLLEPTDAFDDQSDTQQASRSINFLLHYIKPYKKFILQLFLGFLLSSIFTLVLPFLTKSLVDYGINHQNMGFITLILFSQLALFAGSTLVEVIRSWILVHMNSRINISIISDFLLKLMQLPARFFDTKKNGDIFQRIADHDRIEQFLTNSTLNILFSLIGLIIFSGVMASFSWKILLIFIVGSACSVLWIILFLNRQKTLDYKKFHLLSSSQDVLYEIVYGMQEIKLNNCETSKRWEWEKNQAKMFKVNVSSMTIAQYQQIGNSCITQLKNIIISYVSAYEVVQGNMTLGMMLSISYIIGQMNSPIEQLLTFFRSMQEAKISLERLEEINQQEKEEKSSAATAGVKITAQALIPGNKKDIHIDSVSFQYGGGNAPLILNGINLTIPQGKITAIVGSSGSGKTTLLKLLLKIYEPTGGNIKVGNEELQSMSAKWWRRQCGVVMQDGYIFSNTIAENIALGEETINYKKLAHAVTVANIGEFVASLPLGYSTKIGNSGNGISMGQKQRMLIARAVYKDPDYLFFDEATSALDANNEKVIMENLNEFFKGKTVVVIAHRLSTVKNADQIIVLENGSIVETGNHQQLSQKKGRYFELVKNQLELGD